MRALLFTPLVLVAVLSYAEEPRIYERDGMGRIQYHKPSYVVHDDGRVIETDAIGNRQFHKQQYQIKGDTLQPISATGDVQHHKPSWVIKSAPPTPK
jgi:hypothetical protein